MSSMDKTIKVVISLPPPPFLPNFQHIFYYCIFINYSLIYHYVKHYNLTTFIVLSIELIMSPKFYRLPLHIIFQFSVSSDAVLFSSILLLPPLLLTPHFRTHFFSLSSIVLHPGVNAFLWRVRAV